MYFNVNFSVLKQIYCALVEVIKECISQKMHAKTVKITLCLSILIACHENLTFWCRSIFGHLCFVWLFQIF